MVLAVIVAIAFEMTVLRGDDVFRRGVNADLFASATGERPSHDSTDSRAGEARD